jgi:DNA-binding Lrp family transcriptional regulator
MRKELSEFDRRLLDQLQREVPLSNRPYLEIAERLGASEEKVVERVKALSGPSPAPIRQISAIFDSKKLGYQSCLVASKVEPAFIRGAADVISRHPGVSHNYQREHEYNLWFTLAVPPDSILGLERTIECLRTSSGAEKMRLMPALKLYKIGVKFDLGIDAVDEARAPRQETPELSLGDQDKQMIRVLQQHLPVKAKPFDDWASEADVRVDQLLSAAKRYQNAGVMRRFSAVLRHREIGVSANAMGVWVVPPEQQEEFGQLAAQHSAVSHCYLRPTYPDWPYSVFTMVHGKTRVDCETALAAISLRSGVKNYTSLYSCEEFKKVRVKYFLGDIKEWESAQCIKVKQSA